MKGLLKVLWASDHPDYLGHPTAVYHELAKPEWIDDQFVRDMITDILPDVTVRSAMDMDNKYLGHHTHYELAAGVQNLILAYKTDTVCNLTFMGDNCIPWLLKIVDMKGELTVITEHRPFIPFETKINAVLLNDNTEMHTGEEWFFTLCKAPYLFG